jgi:hypothetical protein
VAERAAQAVLGGTSVAFTAPRRGSLQRERLAGVREDWHDLMADLAIAAANRRSNIPLVGAEDKRVRISPIGIFR